MFKVFVKLIKTFVVSECLWNIRLPPVHPTVDELKIQITPLWDYWPGPHSLPWDYWSHSLPWDYPILRSHYIEYPGGLAF